MKIRQRYSAGVFSVLTGLLFAGCGGAGGHTAGAALLVILLNVVNGVNSSPAWSVLNSDGTIKTRASYDINWVDADQDFQTDRGATKAASFATNQGRVWAIDALKDVVLYQITGFRGNQKAQAGHNNQSGPNGVLVANKGAARELWVGDGDSTAKVVDLTAANPNHNISNTIATGGTDRADELAYDSTDDIIIINNESEIAQASNPTGAPFSTFINRATKTIVGYILFDGVGCPPTPCPAPTGATLATAGHGPLGQDGMEQPAYDANSGAFYQANPQTPGNANGEVDKIDPVAMRVTAIYGLATACSPHGLAIAPALHHMVVGCGSKTTMSAMVMDITPGAGAGTILMTTSLIGGIDETWFNATRNWYYLGGGSFIDPNTGKVTPSLGIINAATNTFVERIPTGSVQDGRIVAVNPTNNQAFMPVSELGGGGSVPLSQGGGILVLTP